jgi:hypothetical protein
VVARVEPWVFQNKYGLMYSQHNFSWSLTMYHMSKDMKVGESHAYVSIALAVRF